MIHKAVKILETLASHKEMNSINALSQLTGIPRSTVHRILAILAAEEIVTLFPGKGYVLTPKLFSLGLKGLGQKEMLDVAIPVMRGISEKTKGTVSVNVICGMERVCVYRVEGDQPILRNIKIGDRGPLLRGSVGKVIAAGLSQAELMNVINSYISSGDVETGKVAELLTEIEKIRELGFAISYSERFPGYASIAVPVKNISGETMASLSISTMAEYLQEKDIERFVEILKQATGEISFQIS